MSDAFTQFSPKALTFLRGLKKHNRKDWFEANRATYESELKEPMKLLIEEVDVALATIAPEIIGSPKKSAFRIHRDVRFSKDKSPYKTHVACWFFHRDAGHGVGGEAAPADPAFDRFTASPEPAVPRPAPKPAGELSDFDSLEAEMSRLLGRDIGSGKL
jgi:hypothetical protein